MSKERIWKEIYAKHDDIETLQNFIRLLDYDYEELCDDFERQQHTGFYKGVKLIGAKEWEKILKEDKELPYCGESVFHKEHIDAAKAIYYAEEFSEKKTTRLKRELQELERLLAKNYLTGRKHSGS